MEEFGDGGFDCVVLMLLKFKEVGSIGVVNLKCVNV